VSSDELSRVLLSELPELRLSSPGAVGAPQRCKTLGGQAGLCVALRLCRVRAEKLSPCGPDLLFCCPFPQNGSLDWSLEDREPIVFPADPLAKVSPKACRDHRSTYSWRKSNLTVLGLCEWQIYTR